MKPFLKSIKSRLIKSGWRTVFVNFTFLAGLSSCEDFLQIDPPIVETVSETIYKDDSSAEAAIIGIYKEMNDLNGPMGGGVSGISYIIALSSDELNNFSVTQEMVEFNANSITPDNAKVFDTWKKSYAYIFYANSVLKGLSSSSSEVTEPMRRQLEGEAKFIRAFVYFYLTNLFGDVAIVTSTNLEVNRKIPRSSSQKVYELIVSDLSDAVELLAADYSFSEGQKTRASKFAAQALLARVYLFLEDWEKAETYSSMLIDNTAFELATLDNVVKANNSEAIWQIYPNANRNANEGNAFILTATNLRHTIRPELLAAFEVDDQRQSNWTRTIVSGETTYYYPYKYKIRVLSQSPLTEYSTILRLAEMYLVRSEARANLSDVSGSQADLNVIRNRAGLPDTDATNEETLLSAIKRERRIEFFTEWGHRWLDLKRTGRVDEVLSLVKGTNWQSTDALFPIPEKERNLNRNLSQNNGY